MFLPTGDTPNPRNFTPWVNWALIGANVAVYVFVSLPLSARGVDPRDPALGDYLRAIRPSLPMVVSLPALLSQLSAYDLFVFAHGYKPGAPALDDLLFSMFLHGGLLHVAGNMLFLWIYGDNVEHRLGRIGYLVVYLLTGAVATLFFSFFAAGSMVPLVGASGAISGILGLYFLLFPRNRVKVLVVFFPLLFEHILIPARWVLGFYLLVDNLLPFLIGSQSGVAYGAHIGGFVAGLGVAWAGERLGWRLPWLDSLSRAARSSGATDVSAQTGDRTPLDSLRGAMADDDAGRAIGTLAQMDRAAAAELGPAECVQLAGWLERTGYPGSATRLLRRCLASHRTHEELAEVYLLLGLMRLRQGQPTAAYQHLLSVFDHDPAPETAARARKALEQIDVFRGRARRR